MASRDPRAETVRSVLVRLRTRSGLSVERLGSTEVDTRALVDLPVMRHHIHASGGDPLEAIVDAVRHIARRLGPTDLMIVDAALALGLLRKVLPDPSTADRLYAAQLGDRRSQLVALWATAHELLGVKEYPPAPSVRALRSTLEVDALGRFAEQCVASATIAANETPTLAPAPGVAAAPRRSEPAAVVIVGAAVMDHIATVDHIATAGTSAQVSKRFTHPGGKGLNQAVACVRLGVDVDLVAAVGDDENSEALIDYLEGQRVPTELVKQVQSAPAPTADIYITPAGDSIMFGDKKEGQLNLGPEDLASPAVSSAIFQARAVLLTFEPSLEAIRATFEMMRNVDRSKTMFIVHPSPRLENPQELYEHLSRVDYIVGTPWELREFLAEASPERNVELLARQLLLLGVSGVCVLDNFGCTIRSDALNAEIERPPTVLQDAPGARDAFLAALTYRLLESNGRPTKDDFVWATAAMAAAQSVGDVPSSMPSLTEIVRILAMTYEESTSS